MGRGPREAARWCAHRRPPLAVAGVYSLLVVWLRDRLGLFFFNTVVASVVLVFVFEVSLLAIHIIIEII